MIVLLMVYLLLNESDMVHIPYNRLISLSVTLHHLLVDRSVPVCVSGQNK
jgi:hypothetical protein